MHYTSKTIARDVRISSQALLGLGTLLLFSGICAMTPKESRKRPTPPASTCARLISPPPPRTRPTFDPRNYHAAINRHNIPGDDTIHTSLQAMAYGTKGVFLGDEQDLTLLTKKEKKQIKKLNIQVCILPTPPPSATLTKDVIIYAPWAKNQAHILIEIQEKENQILLLEQTIATLPDGQEKAKQERKLASLEASIDTELLENEYLTGTLLGYPEDDIAYFYEHGYQIGYRFDSDSFTKDKQAAEFFLQKKLSGTLTR